MRWKKQAKCKDMLGTSILWYVQPNANHFVNIIYVAVVCPASGMHKRLHILEARYGAIDMSCTSICRVAFQNRKFASNI